MPASRVSRLSDDAARRLLAHYDTHARALPWRAPPGSAVRPDPYAVWLSEVMLQQTTVATVTPRFARFLARWPTVAALAAADEAAVLGEWAGLGYYARARNLVACARAVAAAGGFPTDRAGLRELPGIGDYASASIAAIAFEEPVAVIDTNVVRVMARLLALPLPAARAKKAIEPVLAAWVPADRPGDFAQALMELGATVCRPRGPRCGTCPLAPDCAGRASGTPEAFPAPTPKKARPHRHAVAWWIERDGAVWLVRRPASGLLGGMAALPGSDWLDTPVADPGTPLGTTRWTFTHFTLALALHARAEPPPGEGWWQPLASLDAAGLPSLYARAAQRAMAADSAA